MSEIPEDQKYRIMTEEEQEAAEHEAQLLLMKEKNRLEAIERRRQFRIGISVEALFAIIAERSNLLALYPDATPRAGSICINYDAGDQHFEIACHSNKAPSIPDGSIIPLIRNITITEE